MSFWEKVKRFFGWKPPAAPAEKPQAPAPVIPKLPAPAPDPVPPAAMRSDWPRPIWHHMCVAAIEQLGGDKLLSVVPGDALFYSTKFHSHTREQRVEFYCMLLSALAKYESGYKPEVSYVEKFKDNKGRNVVSRGLLQLSIESMNGNYGAGLQNEQQLHDPETNIRCGVRAMTKLIANHGYIGSVVNGKNLGMAAYWSPFRDAQKRFSMAARTKSL